MQLYPNHKNFSMISCLEPLHKVLGWIWLGVAVIGYQELKGLLIDKFQKTC